MGSASSPASSQTLHRDCVGVDNFSQFGGPKDAFLSRFERYRSPNHQFHDRDYVDYFSTVHSGEIGVYFYDGEHSYHNQLNGLRVAEPFFSKNCTIFIDDTNDDEPRRATLDFVAQSLNHYNVVFDAKTHENQHPTWWNGLMILQRQ
ncbi:MAG: class I SAM-dependent methyltransferase [Pirellulales bacterium]